MIFRAVLNRLILAALMVAGFASVQVKADEITVFAAASLGDVVNELAADFEHRTGHEVRVVTAASSTLARQIEKGAPADVFISANKAWAAYVSAAREFAKPTALFGNRLVLVSTTPFDAPPKLAQLPQLLGGGRLAIGDPAHVPAGQYAQAALEAAGVWNDVKDRLAPAGDVRSALAFVARGAAQFGIVYATDARAAVPVVLEIDPALYPPIIYFAVTPKVPSKQVTVLMDYLLGPEASMIIEGRGFMPTRD